MRISDWSSDLCSSDLIRCRKARVLLCRGPEPYRQALQLDRLHCRRRQRGLGDFQSGHGQGRLWRRAVHMVTEMTQASLSLRLRAYRTIAWAKRRPPIMQLAATCALEHFTAILANAVLSDPAHLVGADTEAQRMWRWHAVEEIEHKAVASDTWLYANLAMPRGISWSLRSEERRVGQECYV